MAEVEWARLKAHELRELAQQDAVVILPVAAMEQHGPHLPVMTDTRIGGEVARRTALLVSGTRPCIAAPVVWSGLSEHHMPFGGTLTLGPETFAAVLRDLIGAMVRLGFRKILISNSHGGNIIAINHAVETLAADCPATLVATTYAAEAGPAIKEILEDQPGVQHAGEAETAMMMALEPGLIGSDLEAAVGAKAEGPSFLGAGRASYRWRPFAHMTGNGVVGDPRRATPEKGEKLLDAAAEALAEMILASDTWADPQDLRGDGTAGVPFGDIS